MIKLYTKNGCPFCVLAKDWLKERGHEFEEIDVSDDTVRKNLYESLDYKMKTVPIIFKDDQLIGGYEDLKYSGLAMGQLEDEDF